MKKINVLKPKFRTKEILNVIEECLDKGWTGIGFKTTEFEEAWKKYQNKIMKANAESWFKDCDKEVEILKTQVKETVWGNADGETGEVDTTEFVDKMEKDYEKLKEDIRSKFSG